METTNLTPNTLSVPISISRNWARLSLAFAVATLGLLTILHVLSPEFDPSWRMVSEYALGRYSWVLALMFLAWAMSGVALFFSIRSQVTTVGGKIGLGLLLISALGTGMASVFDVNHALHSLAALLGIPSLPIAAMLISFSLLRQSAWFSTHRALLWTANLTWISVLLLIVTFTILMFSYAQIGGDLTADATPVTVLPPGVIALVGWANRLLIIAYCGWQMTVARYVQQVQLNGQHA